MKLIYRNHIEEIRGKERQQEEKIINEMLKIKKEDIHEENKLY